MRGRFAICESSPVKIKIFARGYLEGVKRTKNF